MNPRNFYGIRYFLLLMIINDLFKIKHFYVILKQ